MIQDIVETEQQEQPETAQVVRVPKVMLHVSLSNAEFPKFERCCFIIDLKYGLYGWLIIEAIIWAFFCIAMFSFEIVLINEVDLMDLSDRIEQWQFTMIFGNRLEKVDHAIRTNIVIIYLLLTIFFLLYVIVCGVTIAGIHLRKTCFFIPYFTLDAIFFVFTFIGCLTGLIISYNHLFVICLIFILIKTYVEICVVSMFLQVRLEKIKTSTPSVPIGFVFQDNQATAV